MVTERAAGSRRRALHALLVVLLLLASTAAALHGYALDEHRGGHPCGVCLANAHGGAAPLPAPFALSPPPTSAYACVTTLPAPSSGPSSPYFARAPPT